MNTSFKFDIFRFSSRFERGLHLVKTARYRALTAFLGLIILTVQAEGQSTSATPAPASTAKTSSATPAPSGLANNTVSKGGSASTSSEAPSQLSTIVVQGEGVPVNANALPTRPTDAVYGLGDTVQDTPRSVYQVSQDQLVNDPVQNASDLARYAPSVGNITSQGIAGAPYIRGYTAEVYEDGIRVEHPNRPFDTNAYQSADIVTGPASVIYGPSSNTSGYLNWEAKQPEFDANHTTINTTFGSWDSGGTGSYANFSQQVDNTGPINKDLAYRVSYKQNEADSYYQGGRNNYEDVYAALTWKPNKDITVDWNFEFGNYEYNNVRGYNRVTQDLIDNGTYTGGVATPVLKGTLAGVAGTVYYEPLANSPTGANQGYVVVTPNANFSKYTQTATQVAAGTAAAGSIQGFVLRPGNATYTKIYPYQDLSNPSDPVHLSQYVTNLKETFDVDDDFQIVNKSYYEHDDQNGQTLVDASLQADHNDTFENRTEFHLDEHYKLFGLDIEHKSNSGISQRYVDDVTVFGNNNYLLDPFDLTQDPNSFSLGNLYGVSDGVVNSGGVNSGHLSSPGYGTINLSPSYPVVGFQNPIISEEGGFTNETRLAQIGFFTFHEFNFNDQWTWDVGARGTGVFANVSNPVEGPKSNVGDNTFDILPNVTSSLLYKPVQWATLYATYNYLEALNQDNGGGVAYGSGGTFGSAPFHSPSQLYEVGAKFTVIPNQLYASIAGYYQQRHLGPTLTAAGLVYPQVRTDGFEASLNYQPNRNFSAGINYSWLESYYHNYNPNAGFSTPFGVVADGETVFSATGGSGTATHYPAGNYRLSLPSNRVNIFAAYQFDFGLGFRADLWAESSWQVVDNVATIPAQYNVNLGVFYARPRWRAEVDFDNVTNQTNYYLINGDTAENVAPSEPFAIQGKLSLYF